MDTREEAEDERDRPTDHYYHPVAYAFEPVREEPIVATFQSDNDEDETWANNDEDRQGSTQWCMCGACVPMDTQLESVCCQELTLNHLRLGQCITHNQHFKMLCLEREVLDVSLLLMRDIRADTLERPVNSW